jgi:homoserine dehydrogenase
MRVLLLGFGNVGQKLADILTVERHRHPGLQGLDFSAVGIFTRSHGALAGDIDLARALERVRAGGRFEPGDPHHSTLSSLDAVRTLDYDVLVELTVLSVRGRGEPALSYVRAALDRGRDVVTANKGPIAFAYRELESLARTRGVRLLYESTVMDGAPLFGLVRGSLRGCTILELSGILNSTTNFVLNEMERGVTLESAVRTAQAEGFAEADPAHDLEGWDAAAKITVLANALLGASQTPFDVQREGITGLRPERVQEVVRAGRRLKLVCRAWREDGGVRTRVGLDEVASDHPFATQSGNGSVLRIETDLMGPIVVAQEEPTLYDTAYGVLNDLLTLADDPKARAAEPA